MSDQTEDKCTFAEELNQITSQAMLAMNIFLGLKKELGLFNGLAKYKSPRTSQQVADDLGLKERYVKEWLNVMAVGKIVEVSRDGEQYWLPEERRPCLTWQNKQGALACFYMYLLPSSMGMIDTMVEIFKKDGPKGIPFEELPFPPTMYEGSLFQYTWDRLEEIFGKVPSLVGDLEKGNTYMLEIGCNTGHVVLQSAEHFPNSHIYGIDLDKQVIEKATSKSKEKGLQNTTFQYQDVTELPDDWSNKFDYIISFKVIHDIPLADKAMQEVLRCLKPGGRFSMLEYNVSSNPANNMSHKLSTILYSGSLFHCIPPTLTVENGQALGACWGKENMKESLERLGFSKVEQVDDAQPLVHFLATK